MNQQLPEFVTVDMRGLKPALLARAGATRTSVSAIVRAAVERDLAVDAASCQGENAVRAGASATALIKLSIRMTRIEAEQLDAEAQRAGLARGAYLAGLLAGVPALKGGGPGRLDCLAALTSSNAELATLSRGLGRLVALLRSGEGQVAREYRQTLDLLDGTVRAHLVLAAAVLAALQPARVSSQKGRAAFAPAA